MRHDIVSVRNLLSLTDPQAKARYEESIRNNIGDERFDQLVAQVIQEHNPVLKPKKRVKQHKLSTFFGDAT